ncbi:MAG: hypothetical protein WB579_14900, partial [Bryobacteraceae bacterium]
SRLAFLAKEQLGCGPRQDRLKGNTPGGPTSDPSPNLGEPHRQQLLVVNELLRCGFSFVAAVSKLGGILTTSIAADPAFRAAIAA